jgi:hypothetical protein
VHLILTVCTRCGHVEAFARKSVYSVVPEKGANSVSVSGLLIGCGLVIYHSSARRPTRSSRSRTTRRRRRLRAGCSSSALRPKSPSRCVPRGRQGPFAACSMYNDGGLTVARQCRD